MNFTKEKLAIAPLTWTNSDLPELGKENSFEQCIDEMALAGFTACEIGGNFPKDPLKLKDELERRGLKVCTQWFSFRASKDSLEEIRPEFEKHLQFLRSVQDDIYIVAGGETAGSIQSMQHVSVFGERPIFAPTRWKQFTRTMNELGKIARDNGFFLCFHTHMGTGVQTGEETERLLHDTDDRYIFLNYDSGHFYYAADDPVLVLRKFVSRIRHVHLKDIRRWVLERAETEAMSFLKSVKEGVFTIPSESEGCIDFDSIFEILDRAGYQDWLVVEAEQDPAKAAPLKTAKAARAYMQKKLGI